ncbi:MAG: DUF4842 domain-containing protein [Muribaculaceae bacterium]|nr:DUF4842 domain-containing protein [Muribaculaceae bacterium]
MKLGNSFGAVFAAWLCITGCASEPMEVPNDELYNREFIKEFGVFNISQDWNLATVINATFDATSFGKASEVKIYTAMPGTPGCQLAAHYPATRRSFSFDFQKKFTDAYVEVLDVDGLLIHSSYFPIQKGNLVISANKSKAITGDACPVTIGEEIGEDEKSKELVGNTIQGGLAFENNVKFWMDTIGFQGEWGDENRITSVTHHYRLNNVEPTQTENRYKFSDIVWIIGPKRGVFSEGVCNVLKFADRLSPSQGVEYVLASDDEVSLEYFYGCTDHTHNKFGYLYYTEGENEIETFNNIVRANRYTFIDDASPKNNLLLNGDLLNDGMQLSGELQSYNPESGADKEITGSLYRLVYFGEDGTGNPTYVFPKGTHIIFFITTEEKTYIPSYSKPMVNQKYHRWMTHSDCNSIEEETGVNKHEWRVQKSFVTYKWGNQIVMGVEDGVDHDMNDIMFFVNGNFETDDLIQMNPDEPEAQSWIVAAEDLGGVFDFDFNDVVFGVRHISGETTATVKALASGGTFPVYLHSKYPMTGGAAAPGLTGDYLLCPANSNDGEFHSWFKGNKGPTTQINHNGYSDLGAEIEITVPEDFSMASNEKPGKPNDGHMGGFRITVNDKGGTTTILPPTYNNGNSAPQMILVPSSWHWPKESKKIHSVYLNFLDWANASANEDGSWDWWKFHDCGGSGCVSHSWK